MRRVALVKDAGGGGLVLGVHALGMLAPARAQLARQRLVACQERARGLLARGSMSDTLGNHTHTTMTQN